MHRNYGSCEKCISLKKKKVNTPFGLWEYNCIIFGVGRNQDSESCDRLRVK